MWDKFEVKQQGRKIVDFQREEVKVKTKEGGKVIKLWIAKELVGAWWVK